MQNAPRVASVANAPTPTPTPLISHPLTLALVRRRVTALMNGAEFTAAERLRANDSLYQCDDAAQLQRWYTNVRRVRDERAAAAAPRRRPSEVAAEKAYRGQIAALLAQTGLSHADILSL